MRLLSDFGGLETNIAIINNNTTPLQANYFINGHLTEIDDKTAGKTDKGGQR